MEADRMDAKEVYMLLDLLRRIDGGRSEGWKQAAIMN